MEICATILVPSHYFQAIETQLNTTGKPPLIIEMSAQLKIGCLQMLSTGIQSLIVTELQ